MSDPYDRLKSRKEKQKLGKKMLNNIQNLANISIVEGQENSRSHIIGNVDGVARCINCEIGSWNAWKIICPVG